MRALIGRAIRWFLDAAPETIVVGIDGGTRRMDAAAVRLATLFPDQPIQAFPSLEALNRIQDDMMSAPLRRGGRGLRLAPGLFLRLHGEGAPCIERPLPPQGPVGLNGPPIPAPLTLPLTGQQAGFPQAVLGDRGWALAELDDERPWEADEAQ